MRYVQLRAFHYVAKYGGFSRAAEALNLTQPAISDQVRKLEIQYDTRLFDRQKKAVTLTAAGLALQDISNRMFENEQQALDLLSQSQELRTGALRIIADSVHHIAPALGAFRARFPDIRVTLSSGNTADVLNALRGYHADVGVLGDMPISPEFDTIHLGESPIIAFAAKGFLPHALNLADLATQPLVLREPGSKTRQKLADFCEANHIILPPAFIAETRDGVREVVASGAGIGFVSLAEFGHDDRLEHIPITGLNISMDEAVIALSERQGNRTIRTFMQIANQTVN